MPRVESSTITVSYPRPLASTQDHCRRGAGGGGVFLELKGASQH